MARNPGLNNNIEYGAGEFPLPTRPPARSAGQSTSKTPSMILYIATKTGGCNSPDCRGQPDTGADPDPVALADWNLEFLWSRNAADVGITRDAGDGKNVYSDSNDGEK